MRSKTRLGGIKMDLNQEEQYGAEIAKKILSLFEEGEYDLDTIEATKKGGCRWTISKKR